MSRESLKNDPDYKKFRDESEAIYQGLKAKVVELLERDGPTPHPACWGMAFSGVIKNFHAAVNEESRDEWLQTIINDLHDWRHQ